MGLAERRAAEEFKTTKFVEVLNSLKDTMKFDCEIVVNWDELTNRIEGYSDLRETMDDYFTNCFAKPIVGAIASICADNMGREALKSALKKIIIKSDSNATSSPSGFTFENGELTVNLTYSNTSEVDERKQKLISLIESKL
jgi:hypothetical protein